MGGPLRVGWVISDQLERLPWIRESVLTGGGVGLARYFWLARYVKRHPELGVRYEVYRPWRRYDAVVFLKSMGPRALKLLQRLDARRVPGVFDANVNYFETGGSEYYQGMIPTEQQRRDAFDMARSSAAVIADSEFIAERGRNYNKHTCWIPDNVDMDLAPGLQRYRYDKGRLRLLWSGESVKLFEFLVVEDILRKYASRIELILVTNSLSHLDRVFGRYRERLHALLRDVDHTIVPFHSISHLLGIYRQGGVIISPRFLDSPYNLGHTEWKITLGMACGRMALASAVPSYVSVSERSGGQGIRICRSSEEWDTAIDSILSGRVDLEKEGGAARDVVEKYYSTAIVAQQHAEFMRETVNNYLSGFGATEHGDYVAAPSMVAKRGR